MNCLHDPSNIQKTSNVEIILNKALKGTVRVPILIKNHPVHGFEILNLEQYETALVDPMHDIGGYITNLFDELPGHLNKNDKQLLLKTTGIYKQQKEIFRKCWQMKNVIVCNF